MTPSFLTKWYTNKWNQAVSYFCTHVNDSFSSLELFSHIPVDPGLIEDSWIGCFLHTKDPADYPLLHDPYNIKYPLSLYVSVVCEYEYWCEEDGEYVTGCVTIHTSPMTRIEQTFPISHIQSFFLTYLYRWLTQQRGYHIDSQTIESAFHEIGFQHLIHTYDYYFSLYCPSAIMSIET